MPLELEIIRASEFVRLSAQGHLDFQASKQALQQLARACWKRGLHRALLDLRRLPETVKPLFTPSELASLVATFREAGFTRRQRLAVLYRNDRHHGARMFAFISRLRGWQVQAFGDFEDALFWLSGDPKWGAEDEVASVPSRFASREAEAKKNARPATKARPPLALSMEQKMASATLAVAPVGVSPAGHRTSGHH
jgi:hypothetical protein